MKENPVSPFATPKSTLGASVPDANLIDELPPFNLKWSLIKWFLICAVSGAPSFFFGFIIGEEKFVQCMGMVLGIITYAVFYVFIESCESVRRKLQNKSLRLAVKIGYATRVGISIIFPIGIYIDVFCGMLSVSMTSPFFGAPGFEGSWGPGSLVEAPILFLWFYVTTLIQGTIMNLVLGAYVLVVFAIVAMCRGGLKK